LKTMSAKFVLRSDANLTSATAGTIDVHTYTSQELKKRAAKVFFGGILFSFCGIFIHPGGPLLVMLGLGLSIFGAKWVIKNSTLIMGGKGNCPKCGAQITVAAGRYQAEHPDRCEKCFSDLLVLSTLA
jgi:hypothetical protein